MKTKKLIGQDSKRAIKAPSKASKEYTLNFISPLFHKELRDFLMLVMRDCTGNETKVFKKEVAHKQVVCTDVHAKTRRAALNPYTTIIVNRGGIQSAKTYSIAQIFLEQSFLQKEAIFFIPEHCFDTYYEVIKKSGLERDFTVNSSRNLIMNNRGGTGIYPKTADGKKANYLHIDNNDLLEIGSINKLQKFIECHLQENGKVFLDLTPIKELDWVKSLESMPLVETIVSTNKCNPFEEAKYLSKLHELKKKYMHMYSKEEFTKVFELGEYI